MNLSIPLLILSLCYILLISSIFFFKKKIVTNENKIYSKLLVVTIIGIVLDIFGIYAHMNLPETSIIRWGIVKLYISCGLIYFYYLTKYIIHVKQLKKSNNYNNKYLQLLFIFLCIINFILPFEYFNEENFVYISGPNSEFLYIVSGLIILFWIIYILYFYKYIDKKKVAPLLSLVLIILPVTYIQFMNPELLLITSVLAFVVIYMYFTIENPDYDIIKELNIAKDIAIKANNAKSDFLSSMSHEIRTPLNAIVGLSDNLKNDDNISQEHKEDLNDILIASQTLLEIVGNILDINKIESNKIEIVENPYNIRNIISDVINVNKIRVGDKPIEINVSIAEDIPYELLGDYKQLKTIITNLISNSIKYTNEGYVNLSIRTINKNDISLLTITCEDTGRGITKEQLSRLFNKFDRLDADKNTTIEGIGLGLAITNHIVTSMNGTINCSSTYGKGSLFVVSLPQKINLMSKPIDIASNSDVNDDCDLSMFNSKRILIVDDNLLNIKVAKRSLSNFNFIIDECYDGVECLEKINNGNSYDLILMDIMMPNMSGEEAFKKLSEIEDFNIPVIALTADSLADSEEKYKSLGFTNYLAKPFTKNQIHEKIKDIIK